MARPVPDVLANSRPTDRTGPGDDRLAGVHLGLNEYRLLDVHVTNVTDRARAIANFGGYGYEVPVADRAAATVVVTVPVLVLVLIFQRRIIEGLTAGAVKG